MLLQKQQKYLKSTNVFNFRYIIPYQVCARFSFNFVLLWPHNVESV